MQVLFGVVLTLVFMSGNWFMYALAQDMVTFTAPITVIILNLWCIAFTLLALFTRRLLD